MKNNILTIVLSCLLGSTTFAQNAGHTNGGDFSKTIVYNILMEGEPIPVYNLEGKSTIDRLFFGEINSAVEFTLKTSFEGASGLRIVKDSSKNSYKIEVVNMPDSDTIVRILSKKEAEIILPNEIEANIPLAVTALIREHNEKLHWTKQDGDIYKPYRPKLKSFSISRELAEKLQDKTASLISQFKTEGIRTVYFDGCTSTFRCVIGDELWTLKIHVPQKKALQLSDLYHLIITDSLEKKLNEAKYLKLLDEIN